MKFEFKDKVGLITGGASGIGQATCLAFAEAGASVAIVDLTKEKCKQTLSLIQQKGGKAISIGCDVSDPETVERMTGEVVETLGGLDYLFNNAGISGESASIGDMSLEGWRQVIAVNLHGVFYGMKYAIPYVLERKGAIVNCASILGKVGYANAGAYVASKHAVVGLTKTAALEYSAQGLRVNAVCPGFIETPMLDEAGILENKEVRTMIENQHATKRLGTSEEVAQAVLWLCDPGNGFVTGEALMVDGGFTAM